jgi:hypothetical protein
LKAERTFRKRESKEQGTLDLGLGVPDSIHTNHEPPSSLLRIKACGTIPKDNGKLMDAIKSIGLKHHGLAALDLWDECDDPRDYGYDGDCW